MDKIKKAVRCLLETQRYSPVMVDSLHLILEDRMNSVELKKLLSANDYTVNMIKSESLKMILDYSEIILEDDILTDDEIRIVTLLKKYFQIKDGDFYANGYQVQVENILTSQLEKMYADGIIDPKEALMKTDLQGLFGLSYDQFLIIVNKVAQVALDRGADINQLDTLIKPSPRNVKPISPSKHQQRFEASSNECKSPVEEKKFNNNRTYSTRSETKVNPLMLFLGILLLMIFGYLLYTSFDWTWISSHHSVKHQSFTEYGMNLHHNEVTDYNQDYSWLKWLFYPVDIILILIGAFCIKIGLGK